jgi:hypothetical protein
LSILGDFTPFVGKGVSPLLTFSKIGLDVGLALDVLILIELGSLIAIDVCHFYNYGCLDVILLNSFGAFTEV